MTDREVPAWLADQMAAARRHALDVAMAGVTHQTVAPKWAEEYVDAVWKELSGLGEPAGQAEGLGHVVRLDLDRCPHPDRPPVELCVSEPGDKRPRFTLACDECGYVLRGHKCRHPGCRRKAPDSETFVVGPFVINVGACHRHAGTNLGPPEHTERIHCGYCGRPVFDSPAPAFGASSGVMAFFCGLDCAAGAGVSAPTLVPDPATRTREWERQLKADLGKPLRRGHR